MAVLGLAAAEEPKKLSFESAKIGELPKGWTAAKTGDGAGSVWKVVEDKDAPGGKALAQTSGEGSGSFFNLCVADDTNYKDVDISVSFKAMAGKEDQGGGVVWRYKDANNYYIARMNPLEDNFRVYKVVGGKRSAPLMNAKVQAMPAKYNTIRVVHQGDHIQCYFNGKLHLDVKDDTYKDPGKVGVWSKADAQTRFADFTITGK
jgi:hypothetical protein